MSDDDLLTEVPTDDDIEDETQISSDTYYIDFEKNRIVGRVDGLEAIKQAIIKALITPRFKCLIYDDDYGSEIKEDIIGDSATEDYLKAVIPEYVKDALSVDDRILEIGDFDIEINNNSALISFSAHTVFGDLSIEEVI